MCDLETLLKPRSPSAAVKALADSGQKSLYVAGGTILLHARDSGIRTLIDLTSAGLEYLRAERSFGGGGASHLNIGAATKIATLLRSPDAALPGRGIIPEAARTLATHTIRNLATVGGNIVAWHFPTDLPPVFLALKATLKIQSAAGVRSVPIEAFFTRRREVFSRGDLIVEVSVPVEDGARGAFVKIGRKRLDVAIVSAAAVLVTEGPVIREARVALAGLNGAPARVSEVEQSLAGVVPTWSSLAEAGARAAALVEPRGDRRASAEYRKKLVEVAVRRALWQAAGLSGE
jgi:CO/xanthine dehydrogenase FAD-binding subunit